jgi:hypothetical protein
MLQDDVIVPKDTRLLSFDIDMEIRIGIIEIVDGDLIEATGTIEQPTLNDGSFETGMGEYNEDVHRACFGPMTLVSASGIATD